MLRASNLLKTGMLVFLSLNATNFALAGGHGGGGGSRSGSAGGMGASHQTSSMMQNHGGLQVAHLNASNGMHNGSVHPIHNQVGGSHRPNGNPSMNPVHTAGGSHFNKSFNHNKFGNDWRWSGDRYGCGYGGYGNWGYGRGYGYGSCYPRWGCGYGYGGYGCGYGSCGYYGCGNYGYGCGYNNYGYGSYGYSSGCYGGLCASIVQPYPVVAYQTTYVPYTTVQTSYIPTVSTVQTTQVVATPAVVSTEVPVLSTVVQNDVQNFVPPSPAATVLR